MDVAHVRRSPDRPSLLQTTMLVVLGTETAFFTVLVMTYLFMRGGGSTWTFVPPAPLDTAIAGGNTLVLLASAAAMRLGHRAITGGRSDRLQLWLFLAFGLGMVEIRIK